jgi:hypothetical protein
MSDADPLLWILALLIATGLVYGLLWVVTTILSGGL